MDPKKISIATKMTKTNITPSATTMTRTATTPSKEPASLSEEQNLAEACRETEDMEILLGRKCSLFPFLFFKLC